MSLGIEEYKRHYLITDKDIENLHEIWSIVEPYMDDFVSDFLIYLQSYPETASFFITTDASVKRKDSMRDWLLDSLKGPFNNRYIAHLQHVGLKHVKKEIPIHWVTASMNYKREYLYNILDKDVADASRRSALTRSLDKILDLNLDIMSSSYHEEEIRQKFLSERLDSSLIVFAERFAYGINVVLVLALLGLSISIIALFGSELLSLFEPGGNVTNKILTSLGTLLIIWVMVELIDTEIKYLRGHSFQIEVFVSVGLVAFIRELLISSLTHESPYKMGILLAAILVFGIVYFLISRSSSKT